MCVYVVLSKLMRYIVHSAVILGIAVIVVVVIVVLWYTWAFCTL